MLYSISWNFLNLIEHYSDVIMGMMESQITSLTIVYSTLYSGTDQRKHQSSTSLAFVWGIHWWPVNSPQKWPVTGKIFPFDDIIMMWDNTATIQKKNKQTWMIQSTLLKIFKVTQSYITGLNYSIGSIALEAWTTWNSKGVTKSQYHGVRNARLDFLTVSLILQFGVWLRAN